MNGGVEQSKVEQSRVEQNRVQYSRVEYSTAEYILYVQHERTSCLNSNASLTLPSTAASLLLTSSSLDSGTSGVALTGNGSSDSDNDGEGDGVESEYQKCLDVAPHE